MFLHDFSKKKKCPLMIIYDMLQRDCLQRFIGIKRLWLKQSSEREVAHEKYLQNPSFWSYTLAQKQTISNCSTSNVFKLFMGHCGFNRGCTEKGLFILVIYDPKAQNTYCEVFTAGNPGLLILKV